MSLLAFFSPLLLGIALVRCLLPSSVFGRGGGLLALSLGIGLGLGLTSSLAFAWLVIIGQPGFVYFGLEIILALLIGWAAFFGVGSAACSDQHLSTSTANGPSIPLLRNSCFVLGALVALWFVLFSYYQPHGEWDAWAIWNMRARTLFRAGEEWQNAFAGTFAHPDYPLMLPGTVFRAWRLVGGETVIVPIAVAALFSFAILLLLFSALAVSRSVNQGYVAALFLLATYRFWRHGVSQFADVAMAFFVLATVVLFVLKARYKHHDFQLMFLAGLTTSCAVWTKNEGILFFTIVAVSGLGYVSLHRCWKGAAAFVLGLLPLLSVAISFKLQLAPPNDVVNIENLQQVWSRLADLSRYQQVAPAFLKGIATFSNGIVLLLAGYLWFMGTREIPDLKKSILMSVAMMTLMLIAFFFVYMITPHDLKWHIGTSFSRLLLQLWPTVVFLALLVAAEPERRSADLH